MSAVREEVALAARSLRYAGLDAVREVVWRTLYSLRATQEPDPVLQADWDVLVVLDACRADLFRSVVRNRESGQIPVGESRISPASSSKEWLASVFGDAQTEALRTLAYVTGNPYTEHCIEETRFDTVESVWREGWDDELGTIPPAVITDCAIESWRTGSADRMVVHYMQPHFPSLADERDDGIELEAFGGRSLSVWEELRLGRRSREDVWAAYRANLEAVLDEVESLLENLDAGRVVLTADHGNAFGEKHIYGHPGGVHLPCLREVPWSVTSGRDTRERRPGSNPKQTSEDAGDPAVEDRLEQLGYRT